MASQNEEGIGHVNTVSANSISGWAAISGRREPAVVDIYFDNEKRAESLAAEPRPDVLASGRTPTERCGFSVHCSLIGTSETTRVFVKIRGASTFLPGSGKFLQPLSSDYLPSLGEQQNESFLESLGYLDSIVPGRRGRIIGWAAIAGRSDRVTVEIFIDTEKVAECETGIHRPDVAQARPDLGAHCGFIAECDLSAAGYNSRVFGKVQGGIMALQGSGQFLSPAAGNKLFLIHIPKTGGTTLNEIAQFLYPRALSHVENCRWEDCKAFAEAHYLSGHLNYEKAAKTYKRYGYSFFTILREPTRQFVSHLRMMRRFAALRPEKGEINPASHRIAQALANSDGGLSAEVACLEILKKDNQLGAGIDAHFDNSMTRYLTSMRGSARIGDDHVRQAKDALRELDGIGILEFFPESLKRLSRLTQRPWHEYAARWDNRGPEGVTTSITSDGERLVEGYTWADREVYEVAVELFQRSAS